MTLLPVSSSASLLSPPRPTELTSLPAWHMHARAHPPSTLNDPHNAECAADCATCEVDGVTCKTCPTGGVLTVEKKCAQGCPDGQFLPRASVVCASMCPTFAKHTGVCADGQRPIVDHVFCNNQRFVLRARMKLKPMSLRAHLTI